MSTGVSASAKGGGSVERILGWTHILMAVLLVPTAAFFGLWLALALIAGPVWLAGLGVRFLRARPEAWPLARRTHLFAGPIAIGLGVYGLFAMRAAARSAAGGGGLLGSYGVYPLSMAFALAALSAVTLVLSWREGRSEA